MHQSDAFPRLPRSSNRPYVSPNRCARLGAEVVMKVNVARSIVVFVAYYAAVPLVTQPVFAEGSRVVYAFETIDIPGATATAVNANSSHAIVSWLRPQRRRVHAGRRARRIGHDPHGNQRERSHDWNLLRFSGNSARVHPP